MKQIKITLTLLTTLLVIGIISAQITGSSLKKLLNRNNTVASEVYEPIESTRGLQVSRIGQSGTTPQTLADKLKGAGITISNVQFTGRNLAGGSFANGVSGGLGFEQGVIISSGAASNIIGPNTTASKSTNNQQPGDADLDILAGGDTFDAAVMEMDFVPQFNRITLNYLLASEEYPEMIDYSDVMAIFVDGVNIALLPGSSTPVSISTINNLSNSQLYVDNLPLNNDYGQPYTAPYNTQADGFTIPLIATANVTAGQTHHLKIAIADLGDNVYDSWLLLKEKSFYSAADVAVFLNEPVNPEIGLISNYTLSAQNLGVIDAQNVTVNFRLPLGVTLQSLPEGVVTNTGYYTWQIGTLMAESNLILELPCLMEIVPPGIAVAEISCGTLENDLQNNRNIPYSYPFGNADSYSMNEDNILNIGVLNGVLANDLSYSITEPIVQLVTNVSDGNLSLNSNGSFSYTPLTNYNGSDSFSYKIWDGQNFSAEVAVHLTVHPINDPPVLNLWQSVTLLEDTPANFNLADIVSDPDGDPLTVSVTEFDNGIWSAEGLVLTLQGDQNWFGSENISITISDGQLTASGTLLVHITPIQDIVTNPITLDFGTVLAGESATRRLFISNAGTATALLLSPYFTSSNSAFTFTSPSSTQIASGGDVYTDVTFSPSQPQIYSGTLNVLSNVFGESPFTVPLSGSGLQLPVIAVQPEEIVATYASGNSYDQIITIFNIGEAELNWNALLSANAPSWQSIAPLSGIIAGGESTQLILHSNLAGIPSGTYGTNIIINSNAQNEPQLTIPVTITVTGIPLISISESSIDFGTCYTGILSSHNIIIHNTGSSVLNVNAATNNPEFSVSPISISIPAFNSGTLIISVISTTGGSKVGSLTLASNAENNPVIQLPLTANLIVPPTLTMSSSAVQAFTIGESADRKSLRVMNTGSEQLNWQVSIQYLESVSNWLSINPAAGNIPAGGQQTVQLSFSPMFLTFGKYEAILLFSSNDPVHPNVPVTVTYYKQDYYSTFYDNNNNANTDIPDGDLNTIILSNSPLNPIEFNIYSNIPEINTSRLIIRALDVEEKLGEISFVTINGYPLGILRGQSNTTSITIFNVEPEYIVAKGKNLIQIAVDINEAGDGISVQNAQLVVNNMVLDAQIRYVQPEFSSYIAGEDLVSTIEIDTQLSNQHIMVQTMLLTEQMESIISTTRSLTINAMENDAFLETITIPEGLVDGLYYLGVTVYDQTTLLQQDMMLTPIQILPNQAHIILSAEEMDYGIVPSGIIKTLTMVISNSGNLPLIISDITGEQPGISVEPQNAVIAGGANQQFTISLQTAVTGTYTNTLNIFSNDPENPVSTVSILAQIVPNEPYIIVEPGYLDFGECYTGQSSNLSLKVTNCGPLTLEITTLSFSNAAFTADISNFDLDYNQSRNIVISFSPVTPGIYNSTLTIVSNANNAPNLVIPVYASATLPPQLSLIPSTVTATVASGEVLNSEILISNAGGSQLHWSLNANLGKTIHFNGYNAPTGEFVNIPNRSNIQLTGGAFSISLWAKSESNTGGHSNGSSMIGGKQYLISKSTENRNGFFGIYIDGQDNAATHQNIVLAVRNTQGIQELRVNNVIHLNEWNYITAVYDNETLYFYLNGAAVTFQNVPGYMGNTDPWILGKLGTEANRFYRFKGELDELRIFNSALSTHYIKQTMYCQLSSLEPNLTGYWNFNSEDVNDLTSSHNNGTIFGNISYLESTITSVPEWIESSPCFGSESENSGENVVVSLNATNLMAGQYTSQLQLKSNDINNQTVAIPVQMNVTGEANISIDPAVLAYGEVIINTNKIIQLTITNNGTDVLNIYGINTINPAFTPELTSFNIQPRSSRILNVTFHPSYEGGYSGILAINSNATNTPYLEIPLSGNGALPPILSYNPVSFIQNIDYGQIATQNLNISNSQGLPLEYQVTLEEDTRSNASGIYYNLSPNSTGMTWLDGKLYFLGYTDHTLKCYDPATDTIINNYVIHNSPYSITTDGNNLFIGSMGGRIYRYNKNGIMLNSFTNPLITFTPTICYVDNSLYVTNTNLNHPTIYRISLTGASIEQFSSNLFISSQIIYIQDHKPAPFYALQPEQQRILRFSITAQSVAPYDTLIYSMGNAYTLAHNGRDLYLLENAKDYMIRIDDGIDEFNWLTLSRTSGTVSAGSSSPVILNFNARNTFAGIYEANLKLKTNDPLHFLQNIPVTMNVSGHPQLAYSPNSMDYGVSYLGYPTTSYIHLENNGSAILQLVNITTTQPFSCDFTTLNIEPWQSFELPVTLNSTVLGSLSGILSFQTNDSNLPQVTVNLTGFCTEAPNIVVTPSQIQEALMSDQMLTTQLQIQNTGITPLIVSLAVNTSENREAEHNSGSKATSDQITENIPNRRIGQQIGQYPIFSYNSGAVMVNDTLYVISYQTNQIVKLTLEPQQELARYLIHSNPYGIAWDGTNFWVGDQNGTLYRYPKEELQTTGLNQPTLLLISNIGAFPAFTITGENIIVANAYSGTTNTVFKCYNLNGVQLKEYYSSIQNISQLTSIPQYGANQIWAYQHTISDGIPTGGNLLKLEFIQNRVYTTQTNAVWDNALTYTLAHDGNDFLISDIDGPLLRIDDGVWLGSTISDTRIGPGGSKTIPVKLSPAGIDGRTYYGTISFNSNDPSNPQLQLPVTLAVTGYPEISANPVSAIFDTTLIGNHTERIFTLTNNGNDILNISSITSNHPNFILDNNTLTIPAHQTATLKATYYPSTEGVHNALITIISNAVNNPVYQLTISGSGLMPRPNIVIEPIQYNFGGVYTNATSTHQFIVRNTGTSSLTISGVQSSTGAFTTTNTLPFTVQPGTSKTLIIRFSPTVVSTYQESFTILSNSDPNPQYVLQLSGTGLLPLPSLAVNPSLLDFGTVIITISKSVTLKISNTGQLPLNITSINSTLTGLNSSLNSLTLNPGLFSNVEFTYTASSPGSFSGSIQIYSNDPNNPEFIVPVTGFAVQGYPSISVTPTNLDFGSVIIGNSNQRSLQIKNTGNLPLLITSFSTSSQVYTVNLNSATLAPLQTLNLIITFNPTQAGTQNGMLLIQNNTANNPNLQVPLYGVGQYPIYYTVNPQIIDKYTNIVTTIDTTLTITNTSPGTLIYELTTTTPAPWLSFTPVSGIVTAGNSATINLALNTTGLNYNLYETELEISSNAQLMEEKRISVYLNYSRYNITSNDNEDNFGSGSPDFDLDLPISYNNPIAPVEFNIYTDATNVTQAQLRIVHRNVLAGEISKVYFNNQYLGNLAFTSNTTQESYFNLPPSSFNLGTENPNTVRISIDETHINPTGSEINLGQLRYNEIFKNATLGNLQTQGSMLTPDSLLTILETVNTNLYTQSVRIESKLYNSNNQLQLSPVNRIVNLSAYQNVISQATWILANQIEAGDYYVIVSLYDTESNQLQDSQRLDFFIHPKTPSLSLVTDHLDFGTVFTGYPVTKNLVVNNFGAAPLQISNLHFSNANFSSSVSSLSIPASSSSNIPIAVNLLNPVTVNASLTITSNDPLYPNQVVTLQATAVEPPVISVSPNSISLTMLQYDLSNYELHLTNQGNSILNLEEITLENLAWASYTLSASELEPGDSTTLVLHFNSGGLEHGLYLGNIYISSNDPATGFVTIPVAVDITPRVVIAEFEAEPLSGIAPLLVQFNSLAYTTDGSSIISWEWDFDNNGIIDSNQQNPAYTYIMTGTYQVALKVVTDSAAEHLLVKPNYIYVINNAPVISAVIPDFIIYEDSSLEGFDLSNYFSDPDNDLLSYTVSPNPHLNYIINGSLLSIYPAPDYNGSEQIEITASDIYNASVPQTMWVNVISVNDPPAFHDLPSEFIYLRYTTFPVNFAQYISDSDTDPSLITISITGNIHTTYSIDGQVVTFSSIGDWFGSEIITVTINDNTRRETTSANITLTVLERLTASFFAQPIEVLAGVPVHFTNTVLGNPNSFEWDFENDGIVNTTEPNPQFVYNLGGYYSVRFKVMYISGTDIVHIDELVLSNYIHVTGTHIPGGELLNDLVLAGSPYNISGPVIIPSTSNPVWNPEIEVNILDPSVFIKVEGSLQASGIEISTQNIDHWQGFIIEAGATNVTLSELRINNAETALLLKSPAQIQNCVIQKDSLVTFNEECGVKISAAANAELVNIDIQNYNNGIVIDSPVMASQPILSNIRVRSSSSSIRTESYGLKVTGLAAPVINDLVIEDFTTGAYYEGNGQVMAAPVIISNIRVRNSSSSIRNARTGIIIKDLMYAKVADDSILNCENGLIIQNTSFASTANTIISNIRVRNSSSSIRTNSQGIYLSGNICPRIIDVDLDDYLNGLIISGTNSAYSTPPIISNIRVRNSSSSIREKIDPMREPEQNGVGIYIWDLMKVNMVNDSIYGYAQGIKLENSMPSFTNQPSLSNIRVRNSSSSIRNFGTGIYAGQGVKLTLKNSILYEYGVGLSLYNNASQITQNRFQDNETALLVQSPLPGFKFNRNELILNSALIPNTIAAIKAVNLNGTVINNNVFINYPSLVWAENANLSFIQNIGWGISPLISPFINTTSQINTSYNNIYFAAGTCPGIGNINADPLFANATAFDYHLNYNSPCIDAGDPNWELDEDESIADIGANTYLHQAGFTSDLRFVAPNTSIQFSNKSTGHPQGESSYAWDFENDGIVDSEQENPVHIFSNIGRYDVKFIVTSGTLSDTVILYNYVLVQQTLLPAPQNVKVKIDGNNTVLTWDPVTADINGNPVTPNFYLVYSNIKPYGQFRYIGESSSLTKYSHFDGALKDCMFYIVIAFTGTREQLNWYLMHKPYIEINSLEHNDNIPDRKSLEGLFKP